MRHFGGHNTQFVALREVFEKVITGGLILQWIMRINTHDDIAANLGDNVPEPWMGIIIRPSFLRQTKAPMSHVNFQRDAKPLGGQSDFLGAFIHDIKPFMEEDQEEIRVIDIKE